MSTLLTILAVACGDDDGSFDAGEDTGVADGGSDATFDAGIDAPIADAGQDVIDAGEMCPRLPAAADRVRKVVVAHPFATDGAPAEEYEVLDLAMDGTLSRPGVTFTMGRGNDGVITFTPDGEVGLVAQDDGSLGVFRFTETGVEVTHRSYDGSFYAAGVIAAADGTGAWVRDAQWRASGGGIYWVDIGCDGSITGDRQVFPSKLPYGFLPQGDGAVLFAKDALDMVDGNDDAFLVDLGTPSRIASTDVFPDDDWIGAGYAITANGRHALIGDNNSFSGLPNRVGVVSLGPGTIASAQVLSPVEDPVSIVSSPFDDAAIVVSGFGDAIFRLSYDPEGDPPFINAGELSYTGGNPQLPAGAVLIDRGGLEGLVLVSENVAVRRVRFNGGGVVEDLGPFDFGSGLENIAGAIGVQP